MSVAAVLLLLVAVGLAGAQSCREGYLTPAPPTPADFERDVVRSGEVFLVRVHNESDLMSMRLGSAWEKLLQRLQHSLRTVMYRPDRDDTSRRMAEYLNATGPDAMPWLRLYHGLPPKPRLVQRAPAAPSAISGQLQAVPGAPAAACDDTLPVTDVVDIPFDEAGLMAQLLPSDEASHGQLRAAVDRHLSAHRKSTSGFFLKRQL